MASTDPPTPRQQRYLRTLAEQTGTSFIPPKTRGEASREIDRLKKLATSARHERRQDRNAVAEAQRGGETRVRASEVTGHGSSARWR